jgi:RNA recognition motif-containing protein
MCFGEQLAGSLPVSSEPKKGEIMATKLFVGSLAYSVTDDQLKDLFGAVGTVVSAQVIMDRATNQSKGFAFVEMSSDEEAKAAVEQLNRKELDGREIMVSEARPREDRPRPSFGGGGGAGGGSRSGGFSRGGGQSGGFRDKRY